MAVCLLAFVLNVPASSRAGSLPHWIVGSPNRYALQSAMDQRNRKRHHDHARKRKVEIHEANVLAVKSGAILNRSQANKKFGFMI
jgi:hypothetical protein